MSHIDTRDDSRKQEPRFTFQAESGERLHRYFIGVTDVRRGGVDLWWCERKTQWLPSAAGLRLSNFCTSVHTFKAFKSHVRRHGLDEARLASRFIGFDVSYCAIAEASQ